MGVFVKLFHLLGIALSSSLLSVQAGQYNYEINADVLNSETEETEVFGANYSGKFFFRPVTISTVPLEESDFVKETSYAFFERSGIEVSSEQTTVTQNTTVFGANLIENRWLLGFTYKEISLDSDIGPNGTVLEITDYRAGRYFINDWLVTASVVQYDSPDASESGIRLYSKKYGRLARGFFYSVSAEYFTIEDRKEIEFSGNMYLNKRIVLGASLQHVSFDDEQAEEVDLGYSAHVQYYVTEKLSVRATMSELNFISPGQFDVNNEAIKISAKLRF